MILLCKALMLEGHFLPFGAAAEAYLIPPPVSRDGAVADPRLTHVPIYGGFTGRATNLF
jgi:hypothetical protein